MSASDIETFFTTEGELSKFPSLPTDLDAVVETEDSFPGFCKGGVMIQYGSVGVFRLICGYAKIPVPILNSTTSSVAAFASCLRRVSEFYSDPSSDPISAEDAFNLLRLHIHGGGVRRWKEGLRTGVYLTQDGTIIGRTTPKKAQNLEMTEAGRWKRPPWLHSFSAEITRATNRLCVLNQARIAELCADIENQYQMQSRFIDHLINLIQANIAIRVIRFLTENGAEDIRTTPSTFRWRGFPTADAQLFRDLSAQCTPFPEVPFGPMAMPCIVGPTTTPFTRASVFAGLGKRKAETKHFGSDEKNPPPLA